MPRQRSRITRIIPGSITPKGEWEPLKIQAERIQAFGVE